MTGALFTALKCFKMLLVLCEFSMEFVKCLRFAFLMRFLVLFLYFLYSCLLFRRLNLSRNPRNIPGRETRRFNTFDFNGSMLV